MRSFVQHFAATASVVLFLLGSASAQPALPTDDGRQVVTLVDADRLVVRCSVKKVASLADDDFIRFEFQNDRDHPVVLGSSSGYSISAEVVDLGTGKLKFTTSGMTNGNPAELVYGTLDAPQTPAHQIAIPRGTTISATQPSVASARLLKLPSKEGWRVTATVQLRLLVEGHAADDTVTKSLEFEWRRPDAGGIDHLRARLKHLLHDTMDVVQTPLIATMLRIPEVGSDIPVSDLLHALDTMRNPFSGRPDIVDILVESHRTAPEVLDYYTDRLKAADYDAIWDLGRGEKDKCIWDDRFIEPLVAVITDEQMVNKSGRNALDLLDLHADRWASNVITRQTLSKAVTHWPGAHESPPAPPGMPDLKIWAQSHDPKLIPLIVPYLNQKTILHDFKGDARLPINPHVAPIRTCDSAYNAICVLRGTPKDQINFTDWEEVKAGRIVYRDPRVELQRRDKLVAAMRRKLAAPAALPKP